MPFTTTNPIERDGKTYDLVGISLAVSPGFTETGVTARIVLSLDPYRIDEAGAVKRPMIEVESEDGPVQVVDTSARRTIIFGDGYAAAAQDQDLAQALGGISAILQAFVNAKEL